MMTYNELLSQGQWHEKCIEILHRDQYRCKKCGALGYHNNAYYECDTADELDNLLKGILIEDNEPSEFMKRIKNSSTLWNVNILNNKDETNKNSSINGNILYDLSISIGPRFFFSSIVPTASKEKIQEKKCKGSYLPIDKNNVKISPEINLQFKTGRYFIFENSFFDKYIVRIEKRWPTGVCNDGYGTVIWGSIIISICYEKCSVSLEFFDKSAIDANGNYLERPITPKALYVHHKYYVNGKNPWEYDNDALVTLCQDCHCNEHKSTHTPVYKDLYNKQLIAYAEICDRCGGSGYLPQYSHVEGGVCFKCNGEGVLLPLME